MTRIRIARIATVAAVIATVVAGVGSEIRYGGICSIGIGQLLATCPLGYLERVLISRDLLAQWWPSVALSVIAIIALGRVFCAWVCPTNLLTRVWAANAKVPKKVLPPPDWTIYTPYAMLAAVLFASFWFRFPVFCLFCPVGLFFGSLFAVARLVSPDPLSVELVLLPAMLAIELWVLKSWCRVFCPLGALLSILGNLNRFFLPKIDEGKCARNRGAACGICERACPEGIEVAQIRTQYALHSCTKCFECSTKCPGKGITFPLWSGSGRSS